MIRNIITNSIFLSLILHSVISDKPWNKEDVESSPRYRNRYNGPTPETYAAIPVAVVYEDNDTHDKKQKKKRTYSNR